MELGATDSSGTDDDLPPPHQTRVARGSRITGNGRGAVVAYDPRSHNDMESQIHQLEQEAYTSVLRAFKAQSDAITWEKESLITELRKELRVTDEEHRDLLSNVNADDIIRRIREWRQGGGVQSGLHAAPQPVHDALPSPTVSASHKKQKTTRSVPSLSKGGPASSLHLQQTFGVPMRQPASSVPKRGSAVGARAKKPKSGRTMSGLLKYPSTGPSPLGNMANRGPTAADMNEAGTSDPLIGRKVFTRWPEDNNFYEAIITDYDAAKGRHVLHYDMNKPNESWELVNLKEISPDDIRWEGEDPGISRPAARAGVGGRGARRSTGRSTIQGAGRRRGAPKPQSRKDGPAPENGNGKRNRDDDIEILDTDALIKEVERVVDSNNPDPFEIDKAKRVLKEQEQSLVDAIARLTDASDGESVGGEYENQMAVVDPPGAQVRGLKDDAVAGDALEQYHQIEGVRESVPADHQPIEEVAAL